MDREMIKTITLNDLNPSQRELAEQIGLEAYKRLVETAGGSSLYIANPDRIVNRIRNEKIRQERAAGASVKSLARKYHKAEQTIRRILSKKNAHF